MIASFFKECKFYPYENNFSTPARMNSLEWLTSVNVTKSTVFLNILFFDVFLLVLINFFTLVNIMEYEPLLSKMKKIYMKMIRNYFSLS